jgi:hypothetical protein
VGSSERVLVCSRGIRCPRRVDRPAVFVIVLFWGWLAEALRPKIILLFVLAAIALRVISAYLPYGGFYPSLLALLDVALVLVVFKRDVRIG